MNLTEIYKAYRKVGKNLNHKIMNACLERDVIMECAKLLGISHGTKLIFESEDESSVLMDFALNDYKVDNKNTVEIYRERIGGKGKIEEEILDALIASNTSLFKVSSISAREHLVFLESLLTKMSLPLMDITFSETAVPGMLFFTRVIQLKDFNMTSGVSFAFPGNLEKYILRRYEVLSRKVPSNNPSVRRFVAFYKLNKSKDIDVRYV